MYRCLRQQEGFTLIEIIMVVIVLGLLGAVVIPRMGGMSESSRASATKYELMTLKRAIVGNSSVTAGGRYIDAGFEGDLGHPPLSLMDLAIKPDSIPSYDRFTRTGWNGPYVDTSGDDFLRDAWETDYIYDNLSRTIMSVGGSDTIAVSF